MNLTKLRYAIAGLTLGSSLALPAAAAQTTLQLINEYPATSITA